MAFAGLRLLRRAESPPRNDRRSLKSWVLCRGDMRSRLTLVKLNICSYLPLSVRIDSGKLL